MPFLLLLAPAAFLIPITLIGCGGSGGGNGGATPTPTPTPPIVSVTISPTTATLAIGATQTFSATVAGSSNPGVAWSVQEGSTGGTVTSAGVYVAPPTVGIYHVVATSSADSTKTAVATVTVQSGTSSVTVQ